ncbi:hypothetical protein Tco_0348713 [Tanacetum coccineum]
MKMPLQEKYETYLKVDCNKKRYAQKIPTAELAEALAQVGSTSFCYFLAVGSASFCYLKDFGRVAVVGLVAETGLAG